MRRSLALAVLLLAGQALAAAPKPPLRLGVVSFYNPRLMYLKYQPLVDYLGDETGRPWELVISSSYQRTVNDLCAGRLDLAYLGPFTYVRAREMCGAIPVVRLNTRGEATYRSLIMVRSDSPMAALGDLRGRRFGFGAPLSTSSHLMPRAMLEKAGLRPGIDLECRYYGHHERAARAVLLGEVDACGVRDIVGERFLKRGMRVLAMSRPLPNFPLVLRPDAPAGLTRTVVEALVERPRRDPRVARAMSDWDEELAGGFDLVDDGAFDPVRRLAREVFGPAALSLPEGPLLCGTPERP